MMTVTPITSLAIEADGGGSGLEVILPAPAEMFLVFVVALVVALAGVIIWLIVRGIRRGGDDLVGQVVRLEAENHELRRALDEARGERV